MQNWETLMQAVASCQKCGLCRTRTNVVFGVGPEDAEVMLIGEGPGEQEDLQGEPFVGPAGRLLDDMLSIIDLNRENTYITNIVQCRPPRNRDPQPEEQDACMDYLMEKIRLVKPKVIVCLGRIAACRLIRPDFRITREHGTWIQMEGAWVTATYHPSALLRDPGKRPDAFDDLMTIRRIMKEIGIQT